jgi:type VI secretion system protein ImpH
MRPVSASALESILAGELRLPVRVEPLTGCWEILPPNRRSKLGTPNARLGHGATLGRRQWNLDRRLRIVIGPLGHADFECLLPRSEGYRALEELLAFAVGQGRYEYEVCLLPGPDCIRPLKLTTKPGEARRLGWDSFIADGPNRTTRREVRYLLHPHTKGVPR